MQKEWPPFVVSWPGKIYFGLLVLFFCRADEKRIFWGWCIDFSGMDGKSKVHRNNNTLPTDFCLVGRRRLTRSKSCEFNDDAKPLLSSILTLNLMKSKTVSPNV